MKRVILFLILWSFETANFYFIETPQDLTEFIIFRRIRASSPDYSELITQLTQDLLPLRQSLDYDKIILPETRIILWGEHHYDFSVQEELIAQLEFLKSKGITHLGIEDPQEIQSLYDAFLGAKNNIEEERVLKVIRKFLRETSIVIDPRLANVLRNRLIENHISLIKEAKRLNLKIKAWIFH